MNMIELRGLGIAGLILLLALSGPARAEVVWPQMAESFDGTSISYEVHGSGEPALVFVHGWSCDARYWQAQVPHFSKNHQVVVIDLAGHGHSGLSREKYSIDAFGQDVEAVMRAVGARRLVLIGHSMGGAVIANAAGYLSDHEVLGLVGVDTFHDVGPSMTREQIEEWVGPMREDFRAATGNFVPQMFVEDTDEALRDWIVADMAAAPPNVAISAFELMMEDDLAGRNAGAFKGIGLPVVAINADKWPTNVERNREYISEFEAVILEGTGHFLHMTVPEVFNRELEQVIAGLLETGDDRG